MAQPEFVVKLIVDGRNTQQRVSANDCSAAARLVREMYSGSNVRVIETSQVRN